MGSFGERATLAERMIRHAASIALALALLGGGAPAAHAVPSFARQTGLGCTACHTAFPQLTPFGREFKREGYTLSDGKSKLPPVAVMLQGAPGFTHTGKDQPHGELPARFDDNDNVSINEIGLFYAGRLFGPYAATLLGERAASVVNHVGVFAQGTWDGIEEQWAWDNMEVRAAYPTSVAGHKLLLGAYANNNPTLQDPWNTTPAWGFPFSGSGLAPESAAAPLLADGVSQQVAGFGGYAMLADRLYVDVGAYGTLSADAQRDLGVDPEGEPEIDCLAPYWRVAIEQTRGNNTLELGTYGLAARIFPERNNNSGHDNYTDVGVDLQYQWSSKRQDVTVLANGLFEMQDLHASRRLGLAQNGSNFLANASITGQYLFDKTYGVDIQYFHTDGDRDALLYGTRNGRPDTNGWVFQIDYLPFNRSGGPHFWPRSNVKLSLQYTLYQRFDGSQHNFDGSGRDASDNDTLYLQAWIAF